MNVGLEFLNIFRYLKKKYNKMMAEICLKYTITKIELDVLLFLGNNPTINRASEIVKIRHLTKSHVSMACDSLCKKGLIRSVQDDIDKRCMHLYLLEDSKQIIEEAQEVQFEFFDRLLSKLSPEDAEQIIRIIHEVYEKIEDAY